MLMELFKVFLLMELACRADQLVTPITAKWKPLLFAVHPVPALMSKSCNVIRSLS